MTETEKVRAICLILDERKKLSIVFTCREAIEGITRLRIKNCRVEFLRAKCFVHSINKNYTANDRLCKIPLARLRSKNYRRSPIKTLFLGRSVYRRSVPEFFTNNSRKTKSLKRNVHCGSPRSCPRIIVSLCIVPQKFPITETTREDILRGSISARNRADKRATLPRAECFNFYRSHPVTGERVCVKGVGRVYGFLRARVHYGTSPLIKFYRLRRLGHYAVPFNAAPRALFCLFLYHYRRFYYNLKI